MRKKNKPEGMVRWYSPKVLAQTGFDVLVAAALGRHTDFRRLESLHQAQAEPLFDYSGEAEADFWLDYVADSGDGWDSTYAVARYVSQDSLSVRDLAQQNHSTQRGRVLVFGGDQVYPIASRDLYQRRFIEPYEQAARHTQGLERRDIYAIPGNHDWYDSLVAFTRLFCAQRSIAGSPTRQDRSYFALRLPYGWWLLAADVQLNCDIDDRQYRFFESVARQMHSQDRIILCVGEPYWILREKYGEKSLARVMREGRAMLGQRAPQGVARIEQRLDTLPFTLGDARFNERPLEILEQDVLKRRVSVYIAGDYHHYRRFATQDQTRQKITAGGGGAFLHPTHDLPEGKVLAPSARAPERFKLQQHSFPDAKTSRRLTWRNLAFPLLNPSFGWIVGALYLIAAWPLAYRLTWTDDVFGADTGVYARAAIDQITPGQILILLAIYVGGVLFTDTHSRFYRVLGGIAHTTAHIAAAFALAILGAQWVGAAGLNRLISLLGTGAIVGIGGAVAGSLLWGIYLLVSLNVFGRHANEAFSSLRIADCKNFLRLRIDSQGQLWIYPIGIDRVPRWRRWWLPARRGSAPRLIEGPVEVPAPSAHEV